MKFYEEISLGKIKAKTRIVMPPIATYQSTMGDGHVTRDMLDYYEKRAANKNVGIIVTEHSYVMKQGKARERQLSIADDSDIEDLIRLTECVHKHNTLAIAQLNHAGSAADVKSSQLEMVAPSSIALPCAGVKSEYLAKELDEKEIISIVENFAQAAARAKKAGYDGVEIHSAHGYLLNQFYSPLTNHRRDVYGGSLENRLRIHRQVIQSVRKAVGNDFLVTLRLGGCDYMEGGSSIEDCVQACVILEKEGIDLISLSGGMCRYTREGHNEAGYFKDMSIPVKEQVHIPILLTGGVKTLQEAEQLIEAGAADMIGVGRALMKDYCWEC